MNKIFKSTTLFLSVALTLFATSCSLEDFFDNLNNKNNTTTEEENTEVKEDEEKLPTSLTISARQNSEQENPGSLCGGLLLTFDMKGISLSRV